MESVIRLSLSIGLLLSALAGIAYAGVVLVGTLLPVSWYWGGALAAFAGPLAFALAAYVNELRRNLAPPTQAVGKPDA
jgi:hypothetical protein